MARRSFVFAHLADAHVGAWPRDAGIRTALRESVLAALRTVEERRCEFLLISGDLFHTPVPDPAEVAPIAAAFRALATAGRRVYVIYGSHDYVAHRTSWLDVLAETGIFVRAAPAPVRTEGTRWTLPFLVDEPTGAAIAGISGRSHGLDREYFAAMDSEAFRAHDGFRIFQFHAAIEEYLPPRLREHVRGVSLRDLPAGCDYYAGGHIHETYAGTGPGGGLLINPGAVFGTSVPDLEAAVAGRSKAGLVIVEVDDGVPHPEFVATAPVASMRVFDVDIEGRSPEEARTEVASRVRAADAPGTLLFPRLRGSLREGSLGEIGLGRPDADGVRRAAAAIHWDLGAATTTPAEVAVRPEGDLIAAMVEAVGGTVPIEAGPLELAAIRELLDDLGRPPAEGEGRQDYLRARVDGALRILRVRPPTGGAD